MITEKMIEAAARGLCRLRIEHNILLDKRHRDEAFKQRCEDASWKDFVVAAAHALEAAERAAWRPIEEAPKDRGNVIVAVDAIIQDRREIIVGEAYFDPEHPDDGGWWWAGTDYGDYYADPISECTGEPTHFRPLPSPPEAPKGEE